MKGGAAESQLRHGVRQLQYALPALVALRARWVALQNPEQNYPFFFLPILLTNATLVIAKHDFSIHAVESAENLAQLGTVVPRLIWSSPLGPDFNLHCQNQFSAFTALVQTKNIKAVEERRRAAGVASWLQPSRVAALLAVDGSAAGNLAEFTDVLVVQIDSFREVLESSRRAFEDMAKNVKEKPLIYELNR
jgi:hypothetical protein